MNALEDLLGNIFSQSKRKDPDAATRARCHRLATKLGYSISIDYDSHNGNGYWIENTSWLDETFSTSWDEVETKLRNEAAERKIGIDTS